MDWEKTTARQDEKLLRFFLFNTPSTIGLIVFDAHFKTAHSTQQRYPFSPTKLHSEPDAKTINNVLTLKNLIISQKNVIPGAQCFSI